ncbi:hypothetical protein [Spirosoma litoris]
MRQQARLEVGLFGSLGGLRSTAQTPELGSFLGCLRHEKRLEKEAKKDTFDTREVVTCRL